MQIKKKTVSSNARKTILSHHNFILAQVFLPSISFLDIRGNYIGPLSRRKAVSRDISMAIFRWLDPTPRIITRLRTVGNLFSRNESAARVLI